MLSRGCVRTAYATDFVCGVRGYVGRSDLWIGDGRCCRLTVGFVFDAYFWILWTYVDGHWFDCQLIGTMVAESEFPLGYAIVFWRSNVVHTIGLVNVLRAVLA